MLLIFFVGDETLLKYISIYIRGKNSKPNIKPFRQATCLQRITTAPTMRNVSLCQIYECNKKNLLRLWTETGLKLIILDKIYCYPVYI